jgi:hypothetical protein
VLPAVLPPTGSAGGGLPPLPPDLALAGLALTALGLFAVRKITVT